MCKYANLQQKVFPKIRKLMLGFLAAGRERGAESAGCPALNALNVDWRILAIFGFMAVTRHNGWSPAESKLPLEFK